MFSYANSGGITNFSRRGIDYIPSKRACVKELSGDFVEDYYNTRKWLESLAIERASKVGMDAILLQEYWKEECEAYTQGDREKLAFCSRRLQRYIYSACKSPFLENYLIKLWKAAPRHYAKTEEAKSEFVEHVFQYHKALVEALCVNDIVLAQKLVEDYFDWCKFTFIKSRESR